MTPDVPSKGELRASERAAVEWFARARRGLDSSEQAELDAWLVQDDHAARWAEISRTWDRSMFLAGSQVGKDRDLARVRASKPIRWAAAACLALALLGSAALVTFGFGRGGPEQAPSLVIAAGDAVRQVRLPDGTIVTLDRSARLTLAFGNSERRLRLVTGRARFDVAHDRARRFIVEAGRGEVTAHGTIFDVSISGADLRVALLDGIVEVSDTRAPSTNRSQRLRPGQALTMGRTMAPPVPASAGEFAWTSDMITFDAIPLAAAVAAFNRTSAVPVRVSPALPSGLRFSGAFSRGDSEAFARTVATSFGAHVVREGNGLLIRPADRAESSLRK